MSKSDSGPLKPKCQKGKGPKGQIFFSFIFFELATKSNDSAVMTSFDTKNRFSSLHYARAREREKYRKSYANQKKYQFVYFCNVSCISH